jgi:hypothetical protein
MRADMDLSCECPALLAVIDEIDWEGSVSPCSHLADAEDGACMCCREGACGGIFEIGKEGEEGTLVHAADLVLVALPLSMN